MLNVCVCFCSSYSCFLITVWINSSYQPDYWVHALVEAHVKQDHAKYNYAVVQSVHKRCKDKSRLNIEAVLIYSHVCSTPITCREADETEVRFSHAVSSDHGQG